MVIRVSASANTLLTRKRTAANVYDSVFPVHTGRNVAMFYVDGHDAFEAIADAIQSARKEILLGMQGGYARGASCHGVQCSGVLTATNGFIYSPISSPANDACDHLAHS